LKMFAEIKKRKNKSNEEKARSHWNRAQDYQFNKRAFSNNNKKLAEILLRGCQIFFKKSVLSKYFSEQGELCIFF
jgi:hypothetical protein